MDDMAGMFMIVVGLLALVIIGVSSGTINHKMNRIVKEGQFEYNDKKYTVQLSEEKVWSPVTKSK